ncbi:MAG: N-acetylmuramoyl-L-alanine amidase [Acidimicrobiia bacterium]|nr:N-acetylmuramoyl-L-alanine amidase [Acidimicrobiia bacterium]MXW58608.1 N-acetylmuramoyl-L-alanine amidase [Acidimicrobiia bacterium]MXZ78209.1 N-acetylmuramoyl-L-alanine amidase [Acidimicrobiia bacterium]MYB75297.1 N-acetylmuramoyl-L-alanine amidase [Acidimicrobiia bacterium]MYE74699.1 N-acetylmuramoyl-L-alanine amidase [Acidimicrobiia bacterium]
MVKGLCATLCGLTLIAACGINFDGPASTRLTRDDAVEVIAPTNSPTAVTSPEEQAPPAGANSGVPSAVLSPLGIPVEVLGQSDSGYLVRTPCGNAEVVSAGTSIDRAKVVIDPGHGGKWDTGAVGPNGLIERDLNLTLSRAVLKELFILGIPAVITRNGDYGMLLSVRAAFADALGADALVSIHHNAPTWTGSSLPGTEVFVQSATAQHAHPDSARLGGLLYEEITTALATFDNVSWSRLPDAGVLRVLLPSGEDTYGILRRPNVPAALVEYGYLSNPSEAALFATDEYIRVAAQATAEAIRAYLHSDRSGSGFIQKPRTFNPHSGSIPCDGPALE